MTHLEQPKAANYTSTSIIGRYCSIFSVNTTKQTLKMKQVTIINQCSISSKFLLFIILIVLIVRAQQYVPSSKSNGNITLLLKESSLANQRLTVAAIEVRAHANYLKSYNWEQYIIVLSAYLMSNIIGSNGFRCS